MGTLLSGFSYSIGKKLIMSLTGLFLVVFLVEHLIGNLLILAGPKPFNEYAEFMGHTLIIRIAEVGLFAGFIFHIVDGLWLAKKNAAARPVKYAVKGGRHNSKWFSRNMPLTGIVILVFLILHLLSFFMQGRFGVDVETFGVDPTLYKNDWIAANAASIGLPEGMDFSLWHKTKAFFEIWWYSAFYVLCMVFLAFHLVHGFQSAFQTVGWRHKKYYPIIQYTGYAFAVVVPAAFASIPLFFVLKPLFQ